MQLKSSSDARILAATPEVVASENVKQKAFEDFINDEASVTIALETLVARRFKETLIAIGDDLQLASRAFTGIEEDPFFRIMAMLLGSMACARTYFC